ncbi:peptidase T [Yersinia pseudotuberculosis NBRC 105692]|nr:peptidase T [Yersinia pseudotuberculosis NBRC 105692]
MDKLLDRFFNYVSFDTQAKANVKSVPSTQGQRKLAQALQQELLTLGFSHVTLSDHGCVMATLPANVSWPVPTIGFIAHLDTSPDFSGKNVNPQIVENYRGGDIALGIGDEVLSPVMFPVLHQLLGHTLITTDGKTLLGADDKAGIAEIITAMVRLKHRNVPHGDIRIAFTPDEEVGKGAQFFNVAEFDAQWAYTVDGGGIGELEFENFNAASVAIKIVGNNVHPGSAKGVMVNALSLATRYHQELPVDETPECTEGYDGFYRKVLKARLNALRCTTLFEISIAIALKRGRRIWWISPSGLVKVYIVIVISKLLSMTAITICVSRLLSTRTLSN